MKQDQRADKAAKRFNEGYNCAQSVFSVLAGAHGLDEEAAFRVASAFGGGINGLGRTCGAVTGALMALGLREGRTQAVDLYTKQKLKKKADTFIELFHSRFGSVNCFELLDRARDENAALDTYRHCAVYVSEAAKMMQEILDDDISDD